MNYNYTFDEYQKVNSLSGYMAGTILGHIKYSGLDRKDQVSLLRQLLWCYDKAEVKIPDVIREDIDKLL